MNIWFIVTSLKIGGAEKRALKVANGISQNYPSGKVTFLLPQKLYNEYSRDLELMEIIKNSNLFFDVFDKKRPQKTKRKSRFLNILFSYKRWVPSFIFKMILFFCTYHLYNYLKKNVNEIDVVHHFFGDMGLISTIRIAKNNQAKCLFELTGPYSIAKPSHYFKLFNIYSNRKVKLISVSETVYNRFMQLQTKNSPDEEWIKNNIHIYKIPFLTNNYPPVNPHKENTIVYASNFKERKNPVLFAKAIKQLYSNGILENWKTLIRGQGPLESEIKNILKKEIEEGYVTVGYSKHLKNELYKSKIFVSIISTGNYPSQSAFEAYGNGNILVLSNTGNTSDKFNHKDFVFVYLDIESLKAGLLKAIETTKSEMFASVSNSVQKKYIKDFNNRVVVHQLLVLYSS
ncbi:glycosyltransferase [Balneolaceae bacterium ANBcel3]|nr:glycosyltransferase [Balneolaceae bacterium ANBcel3]